MSTLTDQKKVVNKLRKIGNKPALRAAMADLELLETAEALKPTKKARTLANPNEYKGLRDGGSHPFYTNPRPAHGVGSEFDWMTDRIMAFAPTFGNTRFEDSQSAHDRLMATNFAVQKDIKQKEEKAERTAKAAGIAWAEYEYRDLSTAGTGSGAEFAPPYFDTLNFAASIHAASRVAPELAALPLPKYGSQCWFPKWGSQGYGGAWAIGAENSTPATSAPVASQFADGVWAPVVSVVNEFVVSEQFFSRMSGSGFTEMMTAELAPQHASATDAMILSGTGTASGTAGQVAGLVDIAATNVVSSGAQNPNEVLSQIAQLHSYMSGALLKEPTATFLLSSRYKWLTGSQDASGSTTQRLGTGGTDGFSTPFAGQKLVACMNVPVSNLGYEYAIAVHGPSILILKSDPVFEVVPDAQNLANQLSLVVRFRSYICAATNRYPEAVGTLTGALLAYPAVFV